MITVSVEFYWPHFNWDTMYVYCLSSESRRKGSSTPSIKSPVVVVDGKRMRPGHWLGSVFCVSFSALTQSVGWQEGYPSRKNSLCVSSFPVTFLFLCLIWTIIQNKFRKKSEAKPANPGSSGKRLQVFTTYHTLLPIWLGYKKFVFFFTTILLRYW